MKLAYTYDHHNGATEWKKRDLFEWLTDIFEVPAISIKPRCAEIIRKHVFSELSNSGWALDVPIDQNSNLSISSQNENLAFQLQIGNASRAPYDLLKMQYLFEQKKIEVAALAVPTSVAAKKITSNVVNAERVMKELQLFSRIITVPILLIAFE